MKQLTASQQKGIIDNFLHKIDAKATISYRTQRKCEMPRFDPYAIHNGRYESQIRTYEVPIVEMELPMDSLEKLAEDSHDIEELRARYGPNIDDMGRSILTQDYLSRRERQIRAENPGVQKAWERYQTLLQIAGG